MRFCMLLGFSDLMQRLGLLKNANWKLLAI